MHEIQPLLQPLLVYRASQVLVIYRTLFMHAMTHDDIVTIWTIGLYVSPDADCMRTIIIVLHNIQLVWPKSPPVCPCSEDSHAVINSLYSCTLSVFQFYEVS